MYVPGCHWMLIFIMSSIMVAYFFGQHCSVSHIGNSLINMGTNDVNARHTTKHIPCMYVSSIWSKYWGKGLKYDRWCFPPGLAQSGRLWRQCRIVPWRVLRAPPRLHVALSLGIHPLIHLHLALVAGHHGVDLIVVGDVAILFLAVLPIQRIFFKIGFGNE